MAWGIRFCSMFLHVGHLLLCTGFDLEHADLFLCHILTHRPPMTDRKIERRDSAALVRNNFSPFPLKLSFHMQEKKRFVTAWKLHITETFDFELSQYSKSGSMFSSSKPVEASCYCFRQRNPLCLCLPVQPVQAVPERCPKSSAIHFAAGTSV